MASANRDPTKLYNTLRRREVLYRAWRHVLNTGRESPSSETQDLIEQFYKAERRNIDRIQRELQRCEFKFDPARGIAKKRPRKKPRPIVVASVRNRIVQRAMLDLLQEQPSIQREFINTPTSFGGVKKRAVKDAIARALQAIAEGCKYYAASDIKDFYRQIPRDKALSFLEQHIPDREFRGLLRAATATELDNISHLGEHTSLFPDIDIGVAQGCSLSTLIGNVILREFDIELNKRQIVCLRYIDDFIIFGPSRDSVRKAFQVGRRILNQHGLDAYDPWNKSERKGHHGYTNKPFEFLGCEIEGTQIRPCQKKQDELYSKIDRILDVSRGALRQPALAYKRNLAFIPTLNRLSNVLSGWGKSYAFCNDRMVFARIDAFVSERVRSYFAFYLARARQAPSMCPLMRGVYLLDAAARLSGEDLTSTG